MSFTLLDLESQAVAVQRMLAGRTPEEKLAWLSERGTIELVPPTTPEMRPVCVFESCIGIRSVFFIDGDEIVFVGEHTTYTIPDPDR